MRQTGFTLTELSLTIIVMGLVVGSVLKGQSMIHNAKVHSVIQRQSETQAAINAFVDRYRALPGDYPSASNLSFSCPSGDGNGRIESSKHEDIAVWCHLSAGQFITGHYEFDGITPNTVNSAANPYSIPMSVSYDSNFGNDNSHPLRHNIKLGNMIPSDILFEVDHKIDDGNPFRGNLVFSSFNVDGEAPVKSLCTTNNLWNPTSETNCGAAWLL